MVITKDFESFDPGSSPGRTFYMFLWPNWIRRLTTNQKIGGSSPSRDTFAWMPEGSKGADLRSAGRLSAWVRTPLQALSFFVLKNYPESFFYNLCF